MTTQPDADLRATLHRLADSAEPLPVADDLWQRGRSARHRGQALVVAAVLAIVVSVGGVASLVTADREARTAATTEVEGGAIPRRIEDVPDDLEVTTDLEVGRGSAAFISTSQRAPVVITAADGVPHRLELPGWTEDGQGLALSPDGLRLAWHEVDSSGGGATIGVLDLVTGETTSWEVHQDGALALRELTWSPDSVWVAWLGDADGGAYVGRLRPGSTPLSDSWHVRGNIPDVAVSHDARVVVSKAGGGLFWLQGDEQPVRLSDADHVGAGRFSPDGTKLALRTSPGSASSTFRWADSTLVEHPFPDDTFDAAAVMPLGWLDDRLQLLQVWYAEGAELVVATPEAGRTSTWRRSVGTIDASIAGRVSLAVDLVPDLDGTSSQELTHDFGDTTPDGPPRPLGIELSLFIGLGVAAAIAVLLGLRWLWRRFLGGVVQ